MNSDRFKDFSSDPFNRTPESEEVRSARSIQFIQKTIRYFSVLFVLAMAILICYHISQRVLTFPEKLAKKDQVYLTVKPPHFRVTDETPVENPEQVERVYYTQIYTIGSSKYKAAIVYWNVGDIPVGTIYKTISPYGMLQELRNNERYDGVVFLIGDSEQEYFERTSFDELSLKLEPKGKSEIRIKN